MLALSTDADTIDTQAPRLPDSVQYHLGHLLAATFAQEAVEPALTDRFADLLTLLETAFGRVADATYQVRMEVFRGPLRAMVEDDDCPEIAAEHHRELLSWVDYRAYSIPDPETQNNGKAAAALLMFEARFGPRPEAGYVRRKAANRPHKVKAWI